MLFIAWFTPLAGAGVAAIMLLCGFTLLKMGVDRLCVGVEGTSIVRDSVEPANPFSAALFIFCGISATAVLLLALVQEVLYTDDLFSIPLWEESAVVMIISST